MMVTPATLLRRAAVAPFGPCRKFSGVGGESLPVVGAGVPVGTPRANWKAYGYETRCASVVQVSDYAVRRVKPISLPIVLGSTFELEDAAHGERLHAKHEAPYADGDGYVYGRWGSPTNEGAARQLAALEGVGPESAGGCMLFSSGMAAITGALSAVLKAGDHVVLPYTVYGGTREWMEDFAKHWGVQFTMVSGTPQAYAEALRPNTKVVYTESPANPTNRLTDLRAVRRVIEAHHAAQQQGYARPWLMCDGTFATPYHQRSLEAGVDVSIHSATKYIGGHSDILAGAVTSSSAEYMHKLAKVQKLMGAPLAPLESFLLARGLRTLHVRMDRHGENALQVRPL
jgi:methionine-gamma-lyase